MSEFLNSHSGRASLLVEYCVRLISGDNGRMLYDDYLSLIETADAEEVMEVIDRLLQSDIPFEAVKANIGKIMNVFYKSLSSFQLPELGKSHFLHFLMMENRGMEQRMQEIKEALKLLASSGDKEKKAVLQVLRDKVDMLKPYELHYIKKENILFPPIESKFPAYRCLQLMWSFHDDFRQSLKVLSQLLQEDVVEEAVLNREMGKLFFVVLPIIFREEKVVFPVALRYLAEEVWAEMMAQSFETGWCFIPQPPSVKESQEVPHNTASGGLVDLITGYLSPEQIILMMENLPVDVTYIDENDEVRFFSGAKHRIFPRAKSIIGRKVQNCHPPSSVHIVNEIVGTFRSGERDKAEFWIRMREKFIHIRYFALRDEQKNYKGTIEVSQDVTGIRELTGERRLLEWT